MSSLKDEKREAKREKREERSEKREENREKTKKRRIKDEKSIKNFVGSDNCCCFCGNNLFSIQQIKSRTDYLRNVNTDCGEYY